MGNGQPTCTMHTPESVNWDVILSQLCELGLSARACVTPHTPQIEYFYTVGGPYTATYTAEVLEDVWRRPGVKDGVNLTLNPILHNSPTAMDRFQVCALHVGAEQGITQLMMSSIVLFCVIQNVIVSIFHQTPVMLFCNQASSSAVSAVIWMRSMERSRPVSRTWLSMCHFGRMLVPSLNLLGNPHLMQ